MRKCVEAIARIGELGLNPTEKLIVLTMAMTGVQSPAKVASMIGLPRSTTYRVVASCWEKYPDNLISLMSLTNETRSDNYCLTSLTSETLNSPTRLTDETRYEKSCLTSPTSEIPMSLTNGTPTTYSTAEKERSPHTPLKENTTLPSAVITQPLGRSTAAAATTAKPSSGINANELFDRLADAAGVSLYPLALCLQTVSEPLGWLDAGCDLERDILPVVRALGARAKPQSIRSWAYFGPAVAEARDRRLRGLPPVAGDTAKPQRSEAERRAAREQTYRDLCRTYADTGKWLSRRVKFSDVPAAIRAEFNLPSHAEVA